MTTKKSEETKVEEKNEVAVKQDNAVSIKGLLDKIDPSLKEFAGAGLEHMDASDFKIPMYTILQPLSQIVSDEKGKAGEFYDQTVGESLGNELEVVLISFTKPRVRWAGEFQRGSKPLCRSFDGIVGTGVPGGSCAKCPLREWNGNEKPECSQGFTWLAYDVKKQSPFRITAMSSHVKPTKQFLSEFKMSQFVQYPMFAFRLALRTLKEQNNKGTYFIPKYASFRSGEGLLGLTTEYEVGVIKATMDTYKELLEKDFHENTESFYGGDDVNADEEATDAKFENVEKEDDDAF